MPSYADEMAARQTSGPVAMGPVRLWISRGEVVRGPDGREYVAEVWEEEAIMDTDVISSLDSEYTRQSDGQTLSLADSLRHTLTDAGRQKLLPKGGSLMVLDTNTLLSSLGFCMAIFTQCLARNVHALNRNTFIMSPVMLIIPNTVVRELDNLKSSTRNDSQGSALTIGQKAQRANRWILDATVQQKKRSYEVFHPDIAALRSESVPEQAWTLHVENSAHVASSRCDSTYRNETPDDEIISLCRILKRETHQTIWLCSDDINAKLKAESDSILTFSATDWMRETVGSSSVDDRDPRLRDAVSDMLDQWTSQVVDSHATTQLSPVDVQAMDEDGPNAGGRSTIDSLHASRNNTSLHHKSHAMHLRSRRYSNTQQQQQQQQQSSSHYQQQQQLQRHDSVKSRSEHSIDSGTGSHTYSADRSTASSRWAR